MLDRPQSTQMVRREGLVEFSWGQPDPDLLPVEALRRATTQALDQFGADTLAYGAAAGAGPLLAWVQDRVQAREHVSLAVDEIMITAGNSDALDQIGTLLTQPGDVALVEAPTYHLALRILNDHKLELRPVPLDGDGLNLAALKAAVADLKRAGRPPRLLYTIPTYHNPSGVSLALERRRALVELAAADGFLIVEDDVYRELAYDGDAPPSLWSLAPRGPVLRLGSFAKSLAPGLRLGTLTGPADLIQRFVDGGLRDSGGGVNHYAAMVVGALCAAGDFDRHVARLRAEYRERRDTLLGALADYLLPGCTWAKPGGGFFVWVAAPDYIDAEALLPAAEAAGVTYLPGSRFHLDGGGRNALRLAFSLCKPAELIEGARRLGAALRAA